MKIIGVQYDIVWEDKPANFDVVRRLLDTARIEPGSLIVLPEMFATGFSLDVDVISERDRREAETFLADQARRHGAYVMGGVVTQGDDGRGRNEAVVFDPAGQEHARYAKLHPFSLGGEADHYHAGDRIVTFPCGEFVVAPFVCYDLRFPEPFRIAVKRGVTLFVVIANWPASREAHWTALLVARAIENQAYVIGVNRCGTDPNLAYAGGSMIVSPRGEVIGQAESDRCAIQATLDIKRLTTYRHNFPALRDIRPEYH